MNRGSPLALVIALMLCVAATVAGYVHAQPDSYTSTAVLTLSPRDPTEIGSDDLTLAAARYVAYLSAPATQNRVAAALGERPGQVAKAATVIQQPATVNLRVQVVGTSPENGAAIANALAVAGVRESVGDSQVVADLIVPAAVPLAPSGPPRRLLFLLGGVGALCLGVLAVLALGYLRPEFSAGYRPAPAV
jgi:capsular polysaccharide biosynthesis protein